MAAAKDEKHRYGQHYTPEPVARLLAAFAIRSEAAIVLDPSCGDGRLLRVAIRLKRDIAAGQFKTITDNLQQEAPLARQTYGIERSSSALHSAEDCGAQLIHSDFFDVAPGRTYGGVTVPAEFDAIIGNPPYIRQELMGRSDKERIYSRLHGRETDYHQASESRLVMPKWSKRSDIYVYFFAHAARFLRPGGRLAFLTSSNWLDVGYGAPLRQFLLMNFRVIVVLESSVESFFEDASINTTITVLEREPDCAVRAKSLIRFIQLTAPLADIFNDHGPLDGRDAIAFARAAERIAASVTTPSYRARLVKQSELDGANSAAPQERPANQSAHGANWGRYLRADDVFFKILERGGDLTQLSRVADVRFGVKTGANDFFYVKASEASQDASNGAGPLKPLDQMASVRRGLTTGANEFFYVNPVRDSGAASSSNGDSVIEVEDSAGRKHLIESRFLAPVIFSLKEIPGVFLSESRTRRMFFNCNEDEARLEGTHAIEYIRLGERSGVHKRPTCAARQPWYAAARGLTPAPLILPSKIGTRWLVAINEAGVLEDKKQYGIFPAPGVSAVLLAALLNSTWARCCLEMTCRQLTGAQAIADIDVAVAERIMLPNPCRFSPEMGESLEAALKALALRPIVSLFEEINLADRRQLDDLALQAIGFESKSERETVMDEMYSAVVNLVRRRLSK